jgi:uncharacterized small protein (DUF1192 family)
MWHLIGGVMEDELEKLKPTAMPADMQSWNIEDLQSYIIAMQAEISRVEQMIAAKKQVQSAAAALFGGNS